MAEFFDSNYFLIIVGILCLVLFALHDFFTRNKILVLIYYMTLITLFIIGYMQIAFVMMLAASVFIWVVFFPTRYIMMSIWDLVFRTNYSLVGYWEEDLSKQEKIKLLKLGLRFYRKEIYGTYFKIGICYIISFIALGAFAGAVGTFFFSKKQLIILGVASLFFFLMFEIKPKKRGILIDFIDCYMRNGTRLIRDYERELNIYKKDLHYFKTS